MELEKLHTYLLNFFNTNLLQTCVRFRFFLCTEDLLLYSFILSFLNQYIQIINACRKKNYNRYIVQNK